MNDALDLMERGLEQARLVAIVRLKDHTNAVEIATILCDAGVQFLEFTIERPEGFRSLERAVAAVGHRATLGAGTVLSTSDVARVAEIGARFIVSPNTDPAVIDATRERGLLSLPGALTPSEVVVATSAGARFIKLFPGGIGGVEYLGALRGPFPNVKFVPTGGVTSENAASWLDAGAVAVAMGSNLVHSSGELDGLLERARQSVVATALRAAG
ncbi:MAG TPA: bifunctional 4-hydroxy-2-oxoglutarate aldolase/2-dehydro-3-deoxy-phosphogluconate aldolase [Acidimicrobiales bacterium]